MEKKKIFIGILVSLFLLLAATILFSYLVLQKYIPNYEGEITVSGISESVKIYRDSLAVAYIIADKELDAAYALGYVHAQERMFQMDMIRRAGEGRLSEVLGTRTIAYDKMFRTLGLYKTCLKYYSQLNQKSRDYLEAYSKGVNTYMSENKGNLAIEFDLLGYDPYPWKPEHSMLISKIMAWQLNIGWWSDISFAHLLQKLPVEKVKEIIPDYEENAPTIIPADYKKQNMISLDFIDVNKSFRNFFGLEGTHIGSNNWVVNGNKSISGKPIIANDPHLSLQAPGTWFVAVIKSDNWNVSGFTLPGSPGVVIGKNENISWVLTNVMADDCDLYMETLDSSKTKYMLDGKWENLSVTRDTILVKDSTEVEFFIRNTHRGPIISDVHLYNTFYNSDPPDAVISMRWTAYEFSDEIYALLSVNRANDWQSFKEGVKHFTVPGQNFVYADKENNIGYICAARLPKRKSNSPTMVYDGTTSEYDWKGYIDYEDMPMLYNPAQNYIASANNKTIYSFPYHITNTWEPPSRIKRIVELLESKEKHSVSDFEKYQNDFYSFYAKDMVPYILNAFESFKIKDKNLELSLELLRKWDYIMDKDSQVPTIYTVYYQNLLSNIFKDEMGEALLKEYVFLANVPYRVVRQLMNSSNSIWFDNISTPSIELRDDIIRKSLTDALSELENKFGKNIADWQWGDLHKVLFKHSFHGQSSLLDNMIDIGPYGISGDGTTIFNTEYSFTDPYMNNLGPSMRFIYDFNNPDIFEFVTTTGQSGHFNSDHYNDMTYHWLKGKYFKINTNLNTIQNSGLDKLILNPK